MNTHDTTLVCIPHFKHSSEELTNILRHIEKAAIVLLDTKSNYGTEKTCGSSSSLPLKFGFTHIQDRTSDYQTPNDKHYIWKTKNLQRREICGRTESSSVPDPHTDPYVFGPPGSASGSVSYKYGSFRSFPILTKVLCGLN